LAVEVAVAGERQVAQVVMDLALVNLVLVELAEKQ
jgi:hypothetical protein